MTENWTKDDKVVGLILTTVGQMAKDRGLKESKEGGKSEWPSLIYENKDKVKTLIYFITSKSPLVKDDLDEFNEKVGYVAKTNTFSIFKNCILIYPDPPYGKKNPIAQYLDGYRINPFFQSFTYKQLTYNPTLHITAPKVTIIPEEEAENKLKELSLSRKNLDVISSNEILMAYYGIKKGAIVMFERYVEIECVARYTISYRRVV